MSLKLLGSEWASCTQRVQLAAFEAGVKVEVVPVDLMKGEQKTEEYLKLQPFGQIPVLIDEEAGITMHESRAIARYIANKAKAGHLVPLPSDVDYLQKLAKFETAASIEYSDFEPFAGKIAVEGFFKPSFSGAPVNQELVNSLAKDLDAKLDGYERLLSKQAFLTGDSFTLADLLHVPHGRTLFKAGQGKLIESRPAVARWWKSLTDRESVRHVFPEYA